MTSQPAFSHEGPKSRRSRLNKKRRGRINPIDALSLSELDTSSAGADDVDATLRRLLFV